MGGQGCGTHGCRSLAKTAAHQQGAEQAVMQPVNSPTPTHCPRITHGLKV